MKLFEFSKTLGMRTLKKNESKTFQIFKNLVYRNLKKMNPKLYEFSETWKILEF